MEMMSYPLPAPSYPLPANIKDFHQLKVWQTAHAMTLAVYKLTRLTPVLTLDRPTACRFTPGLINRLRAPFRPKAFALIRVIGVMRGQLFPDVLLGQRGDTLLREQLLSYSHG